MSERIKMITASDLKPLLDELSEMKSIAESLRENTQPLFQGKRFMTDSALSRRLNICKRTLATYRANGALGYYNLPGKILYSDADVEAFLQRHYLPPFRKSLYLPDYSTFSRARTFSVFYQHNESEYA